MYHAQIGSLQPFLNLAESLMEPTAHITPDHNRASMTLHQKKNIPSKCKTFFWGSTKHILYMEFNYDRNTIKYRLFHDKNYPKQIKYVPKNSISSFIGTIHNAHKTHKQIQHKIPQYISKINSNQKNPTKERLPHHTKTPSHNVTGTMPLVRYNIKPQYIDLDCKLNFKLNVHTNYNFNSRNLNKKQHRTHTPNYVNIIVHCNIPLTTYKYNNIHTIQPHTMKQLIHIITNKLHFTNQHSKNFFTNNIQPHYILINNKTDTKTQEQHLQIKPDNHTNIYIKFPLLPGGKPPQPITFSDNNPNYTTTDANGTIMTNKPTKKKTIPTWKPKQCPHICSIRRLNIPKHPYLTFHIIQKKLQEILTQQITNFNGVTNEFKIQIMQNQIILHLTPSKLNRQITWETLRRFKSRCFRNIPKEHKLWTWDKCPENIQPTPEPSLSPSISPKKTPSPLTYPLRKSHLIPQQQRYTIKHKQKLKTMNTTKHKTNKYTIFIWGSKIPTIQNIIIPLLNNTQQHKQIITHQILQKPHNPNKILLKIKTTSTLQQIKNQLLPICPNLTIEQPHKNKQKHIKKWKPLGTTKIIIKNLQHQKDEDYIKAFLTPYIKEIEKNSYIHNNFNEDSKEQDTFLIVETQSTKLPHIIQQKWKIHQQKRNNHQHLTIHKYSTYNRRIKYNLQENQLYNYLRKQIITRIPPNNPIIKKHLSNMILPRHTTKPLKENEFEHTVPFQLNQQLQTKQENTPIQIGIETKNTSQTLTKLKILSINIGGKLAERIESDSYHLLGENPTIIAFSEHMSSITADIAKKKPELYIPGYTLKIWQPSIKKKTSGRGSGGLAIYVNNCIINNKITIIMNSNNIQIFNLTSNLPKPNNTIKIIHTYIPPQQNRHP